MSFSIKNHYVLYICKGNGKWKMYTYLTDWSKLVHGYVIRRIDKLRGMIVYVFHVDRHRQVRRNLRAKTLKCAARATASSLYPSHLILHGIPPLDAYTFHTRLFLVARIALFEIGTNQLSQLATKKEFIRVLCRCSVFSRIGQR